MTDPDTTGGQAQTLATYRYDGTGRRIQRSLVGAGDLNATYHEYYQGRSVVEVRNAGTTPHPQGAVLKQRVWAGSIAGGGGYIDELVQIAINHDPTDPTENRCHRFLAALHDVNYNVLGVVADDGGAAGGGVLTERYVYSPYGQRQVFGHGWHFADLNGDGRVDSLDLDIFDVEYFGLSGDSAQPGDLDADGDADLDDRNRLSNALGWNHDHDPHLLTPRTRSARVEGAGGGGVQQPFGLCRIGHQGLAHDEETDSVGVGGLIYNRARMRSVHLGRFLQRDPLGYVDGMSSYVAYHIMHEKLDPTGLLVGADCFYTGAFRLRTNIQHFHGSTYPRIVKYDYICECKYICEDYDLCFVSKDATLMPQIPGTGFTYPALDWVRDPSDDTEEWVPQLKPQDYRPLTYNDYLLTYLHTHGQYFNHIRPKANSADKIAANDVVGKITTLLETLPEHPSRPGTPKKPAEFFGDWYSGRTLASLGCANRCVSKVNWF